MTKQSEYLGVYHNTQASSAEEVPFRVAIKNMYRGESQWTNYGYTKSEAVAARVYNVYAVLRFGAGAILNSVELTAAEQAEFDLFMSERKRPERLVQARDKAKAILKDGSHQFKTHDVLRAEQAAQEATQAEALAAVAADAVDADLRTQAIL